MDVYLSRNVIRLYAVFLAKSQPQELKKWEKNVFYKKRISPQLNPWRVIQILLQIFIAYKMK